MNECKSSLSFTIFCSRLEDYSLSFTEFTWQVTGKLHRFAHLQVSEIWTALSNLPGIGKLRLQQFLKRRYSRKSIASPRGWFSIPSHDTGT